MKNLIALLRDHRGDPRAITRVTHRKGEKVDPITLARWQFGITTVYHWLQVPLTIGLSVIVAYMQTKARKTGDPKWQRITDFFGKILLINFALGVATGIVQEFQFGLNWSEYSRFVGDIFGAPLAFEALLAFFLESTFLGLWIFGKGRLSPKMHNLTIWLFSMGTVISAAWILAANSFMQDPHGAVFNPETGRAELDGMAGFLGLFANTTWVLTFLHTLGAAFTLAGVLVAGFAFWWMARSIRLSGNEVEAREYWKPTAKLGLKVTLVAAIIAALSGHYMGQHLGVIQPPKAAAMMGVCQGEENAKLSLVMWGNSCEDATSIYVPIPGLESFMMTNHWSGPDSRLESISEANERVRDRIHQMENVNAELVEKFDTAFENQQVTPNVLASYYSFRVMVGVGMLDLLIAVLGLWVLRGDRIMRSERWGKFWLWMIPLQFVANSAGWILTEIGRQPWIVYPTQIDGVLLMTDLGVSHSVNGGSVAFSLTIFTVLYSALGVVWIWLLGRYLREGINTHKKVVEYDAKSTPNFVY
ncbi:hypothetical protein HMPREF9237_01291 [Actinotignum schaalii FB123-CNA-2]|uniref:Cytochrome d ubiquinol oxidase, subunit I n=4 Tax=Bacillati TaxID=1783272 RepID=S2VKY9_9ACTO|nr:hypothetical protein HMPREF9237_01291 [Actinotignum schaalii FB123-CNA-2]